MKINQLMTLIAGGFAALMLSGCTAGMLYTGTTSPTIHPKQMSSSDVGGKSGKSCISSYVGMIALGDASVKAAAKDGGISKVYTVDSSTTAILGGVFTRQCTMVSGD